MALSQEQQIKIRSLTSKILQSLTMVPVCLLGMLMSCQNVITWACFRAWGLLQVSPASSLGKYISGQETEDWSGLSLPLRPAVVAPSGQVVKGRAHSDIGQDTDFSQTPHLESQVIQGDAPEEKP